MTPLEKLMMDAVVPMLAERGLDDGVPALTVALIVAECARTAQPFADEAIKAVVRSGGTISS